MPPKSSPLAPVDEDDDDQMPFIPPRPPGPPGGGSPGVHSDGTPMLPGYTHILEQQQHQMGLIAQHQESHRRLLAHLEFQQAQESLARARQMEDNRRMVEEAVGKNQSSADALNRTMHALLEHQRRPRPDFQAALEAFASQITQGNVAVGQAIHSSLEAHAHTVLHHMNAMNNQQPSFEAIASQSHVIRSMLEEDRLRRTQRSMSPEAIASAALPPPPPPGDAPATGSGEKAANRQAKP